MRCCVVIIPNMYIITTSNNIHITYDDNTAAHRATCGFSNQDGASAPILTVGT